MRKAEKLALEEYPIEDSFDEMASGKRIGFINGYEQAIKDLIADAIETTIDGKKTKIIVIDCEYEREDITAECVGDIIDLLTPCSREASVFMTPPKEGDNIQQVQVWDCVEVEHKISKEHSIYGVGFRKAFMFTIGEHGPHDMSECYKKQVERAKNKKPIALTEEQMEEIAQKFFDNVYYSCGENHIFIDGPIYVDEILAVADYIRQITSE